VRHDHFLLVGLVLSAQLGGIGQNGLLKHTINYQISEITRAL
jgi:hypothetical protein